MEKVLNPYSLASKSVVLTSCCIVSPNYLIQLTTTYCDHLGLAGRGEIGRHRSVGEDPREQEGLERRVDGHERKKYIPGGKTA